MSFRMPLKRIARFDYGDALASTVRSNGTIPVVGSGGVSGNHDHANSSGPTIAVGRKGSFGTIHWIDEPCFVIDTAYTVTPISSLVDKRWLFYVLRGIDLKKTSQDVGVPGLSREAAYSTAVPTPPPLDEQRRIADFLDAETARIDRVRSLRSAQLDLLTEHTTAALGELFETSKSGRIVRVKHLLALRPRYGVLVPQFTDDGVSFIRVNDLLDLAGRAETLLKIPHSLSAQYPRTQTRRDDVLLSVVGTMGRAAIVPEELVGANIARAVASLRVLAGVDARLLIAWIRTTHFGEKASLATGTDTAQPTLGMEDLANFAVRWPSNNAEQQELSKAAQQIDGWASNIRRLLEAQLALLAERRQALITAAVTGQFDVTTARGADLT